MSMLVLIKVLFIAVTLLLSVPVTVFVIQIVLSHFRWRHSAAAGTRGPIAVLIPAHNESGGIANTLKAIQSQLLPGDRVLVVADNCNDDTAQQAKLNGAEVIERSHDTQRGKGYALDYGVRHLAAQPPAVVIIVDADCIVHDGALDRLTRECIEFKRPIQALYLMKPSIVNPSSNVSLKARVAEFAWAVRNWARPIGFHQLGLPCQLMGTGMAFPWRLLHESELASGHIVEDMKLGMDCARIGRAPKFCPDALVTSTFPTSAEGVNSQRTRWEHGHIGMLLKEGLPSLLEGTTHRNKQLFFLALDITVPPLAMLVLLVGSLSLLGAILTLFSHDMFPGMAAWCLLLLIVIAVLMAWWKYARHILSLSHLMYAPFYVLSKLPIYMKFFVKRQVEWVRSRRD